MLPFVAAVVAAFPVHQHGPQCFHHLVLGQAPEQALAMSKWPTNESIPGFKGETSLGNVTKLTFGGQNAEAYWSLDGKKLVWQTAQPEFPDEQIFSMNADGSGKRLLSTGLGRTTCSYFTPRGDWIYFSSTHEKNRGKQLAVDMSKGYVWRVNPEFALYRVRPDGKDLEKILEKKGYVAETTIAPDGSFMTLTGSWDGDLEIYRASLDGKNLTRLTDDYGYDGGPFVSWDSKHIVYRRSPEFTNDAERKEYANLLSENLVRPGKMDIWIMDADGKNKRQVTKLPGASFAPFLLPNNKQIIFSSNHHDPKGREFDLFLINVDGTGLKQITFTPDFDGFPMVSRDGKKLVWASNRHGSAPRETNVFVADWKG